MDQVIEILSAVCFVAAVACAAGSLVIGIRAWIHRWDVRMSWWHRTATRSADAAARTIRLPDERSADTDQFARK